MTNAPARARALTLVEVLVVGVILITIAAVFLMLGQRSPNTGGVMDAANLRGIHQGMVLFSQNYNDQYPLPSVLDKDNHTVSLAPGTDPTTKDTTAAIISTLIYGNFFGPEICISRAESNGTIVLNNDYAYAEPRAAANPKLALWDPAFAADFTKGESNLSYAHMLPSGPRLAKWSNTFNATEAVLGNRGPRIAGITSRTSSSVTPAYDTASNTLLIHGGRSTWEGNIVYNDNHVSFESLLAPETTTYADASGATWPDLLHFDEPDDPAASNNFLGVFTAAGPKSADFTSIWD
jgi:hypothetical protein